MRERLQNYLSNTKFSITVSKIDASAAIAELKQQIRTEVMGLTAAPVGKGANAQPPNITVAQKELNMLTRSADSIYRRASSAGGGQAEDIIWQYRELSAEIQKARTLEGDALTEAAAGIQKKVAALRSEMDALSSIDKVEQQRLGTLRQITQLEGKLDRNLTKTLPGQTRSVGDELSGLKVDARAASSKDELVDVRNRYQEVAAAAKAAGLEAKSFGSKLQGEATKLSVWALATSMIMGAVKAVKSMVENVKLLDAELIELKKVTDLTTAGYAAMVDEASVISRDIGAKLSDTIHAEADFARLGYDVNGQAQALAATALVYKHVGDGIKDISESSESIISTMKAFGIEAENAMQIVDAFNEVGNNFAISSSGVGAAMQRSSAALAAANNSLEESIGLTVGMNNVIQNPELVGTALKTVSMYLRAAKADLEAAGESTDGMATSTSKLRESVLALTGQKVDIQLDESTFKSTYQIMKEISVVWSDIADIDQAALLELLGGKRNATAVVSLLTNFSDAEKAYETALNSAGSAMQENEKWLTGIEGHLAQFSAAFENLSQKVVNSELFKGLVDTGTLFIDVLSKISDGLNMLTGGLGGVPLAVAAVTGAIGIMSKNGVGGGPFDFAPGDIQKAAEAVKAFSANIHKSVSDVGLIKTGLGEAKGAVLGIREAAQNAGSGIQSFWTGFSNSPKDVQALLGYAKELTTINDAQAAGLIDIQQNNALAAEAYDTHIASVDGLKTSTKSTAAAMQTGAISAKAFASGAGAIGTGAKVAAVGLKALSVAANMLFNMAIAAAITAIINGISKLINHAEIAAEKAREAAKEALDAATQQEESYDSLVSLVSEYQKISASGRIDTENIEKARDLQNQIVKIVGNQVEGLDLVNGASEEQLAILREQLRLRAEDARIAATAAYNASVKATENAQPQASKYFGLHKGAYISKAWASDDEAAARTALKNAGLWKDAYDTIKLSLLLDEWKPAYEISLDFDMDGNKLDTVFKKINFLREQIHALEDDASIDVSSNPVYLALVQQVQAFEAAAAPNIEASVKLLESVATAAELDFSNRMAAVKDLNEYKALESDLLQSISENASLAGPLESGAIEMSRVEGVVDSILARNLPEWFDAARGAAVQSTAAFADASILIENIGTSIDEATKRQKILQAAMSEMGSPAGNGGISAETVKSIQDAISENEKLTDYIIVQNGVLQLNAEAWNNRTFGDIKSQIDQLQAANRALGEQNAQLGAQNNIAGILESFTESYAANSKQIKENTAKIQENQAALETYQAIYDQLAFVDVWGFANMANDLGAVQSAASGLTSAMQQLREGTALTKSELAKLAIQYPELLSASKLFEDGSVAGQKRILDAALQAYEAQYDAEIDKDIAVLTATNQLLQDQIDLEDQKTAILAEINAKEVTDRVSDAVWLQEQLAALNDLEGENYVTMEDGKLKVNQEALEKTLAQTASYGQQSTTIWARISTNITSWFQSIAQKARNLAKVIANALSGKTDDSSLSAGADAPALLKDSDLLKIQGQSIAAWTSEQESILAQRREALQSEIDKNLVAIDNLQKLKGLDLTSVYGSSSSSSSGKGGKDKKDAEDYTATINELHEAEVRLADAQRARAEIETQISREGDPAARIGLRRQLIDAYNEEIAADENLLRARQALVDSSIDELRRLGFEVEYNNENNRLYIANMEHLNELTATSKGKYDSLQEATNELRKSTEQVITQVENWNNTNQSAATSIDGLRDSMRKAKTDILADIEEIRKNAESALKDARDAYSKFQGSLKTFGKAGLISLDDFESLMSMESKYLNYLQLEGPFLAYNEREVRNLIAAKVDQMAVEQAMALVNTIEVHRDDAEALRKMADATYEASDATWELVYAKLSAQNLDPEMYGQFKHQIDMMKSLANRTKLSVKLGIDSQAVQSVLNELQSQVSNIFNTVVNTAKSLISKIWDIIKKKFEESVQAQKDGLNGIMDLTKELVRWEVEQKIQGLRDQIEAYQKIVDLKKEQLDLSRKEADYEDGIAERVKEIARLESEIAQLSLDDSREAKVLRIKKEEELAEKQKELAKYQDDHAYDAQVRALDDAAKAYAEAKEEEIRILEESISSEEKVYQLALERIGNGVDDWLRLGADLEAYVKEHGNILVDEFRKIWTDASRANWFGVLSWQTAIDKITLLTEGVGTLVGQKLTGLLEKWLGGISGAVADFFGWNKEQTHAFVNAFSGVAGNFVGSLITTGTQIGGAVFSSITDAISSIGSSLFSGATGLLGNLFGGLFKFHNGGHVGGKVHGRTGDPAEEVVAILQTDEVVLTKQQQKNLLTQLDFLRELGANVDAPVSLDAGYAGVLNRLTASPQRADSYGDISNNGDLSVSAPIEVIIQHSGEMNDASAAQFGKKVAETTVGSICEAFRKKGIHVGSGNGALKP